jgi:hypothetical protein
LTDASQYLASLPGGVLVGALPSHDVDEQTGSALKPASKVTRKRSSQKAKPRRGAN